MISADQYHLKNLSLKLTFLFILFTIILQSALNDLSQVFSSSDNNSVPSQTNRLDPQRNIITSQNTGNSNNNGGNDGPVDVVQDQNSALTLENSQTAGEADSVSLEAINENQNLSGLSQSPAARMNPSCGQIVQGNVQLSSNLICTADGIIIGGNNTYIDMNGFSLKGPGTDSNKVGIMIGGQNNVTISGNGIISGFQSGIYISGSTNVYAHGINVNNNKVAFYITGSQNPQISNNMVGDNTIAVALHSSKNAEIKYNQMNENNLSGITLINSANSTIHGNNILNTSNGIFLDTQSSLNKIDFNNVFNNILDINNANNLPININNNYYSNNNCQTSLPSGLCIGR